MFSLSSCHIFFCLILSCHLQYRCCFFYAEKGQTLWQTIGSITVCTWRVLGNLFQYVLFDQWTITRFQHIFMHAPFDDETMNFLYIERLTSRWVGQFFEILLKIDGKRKHRSKNISLLWEMATIYCITLHRYLVGVGFLFKLLY